MRKAGTTWAAVALAFGVFCTGTAAAATPSPEEMWAIIQQQQRTIAELKARLDVAEGRVQEQAQQLEATAEALESAPAPGAARQRTTVGGYGELHYNTLDNDGTGSDKNEVDFHRFVLFFGHEFTDTIRFFSELEVEHALVGEGKPGEVELEQAYVELDLTPAHHLRAGLDLLPLGMLNETHEPNTFFGVERNPVESEIIPATWWEAVFGVHGELAPGLSYHVVGHSGLSVPTTGGSAFRIRSGRGKVAKAKANDGAVTLALAWRGVPGLELGGAFQYQADVTQGAADIAATLWEAHLDWRRGPWGLRALYAQWDLDDGLPGVGPKAFSADRQAGWYVEPSWRTPLAGILPGEVGVFARYHRFDARNEQAMLRYVTYDQVNVGLNYWPHPNVVFKADWQWQDAGAVAKNEFDGLNLGIGYQF